MPQLVVGHAVHPPQDSAPSPGWQDGGSIHSSPASAPRIRSESDHVLCSVHRLWSDHCQPELSLQTAIAGSQGPGARARRAR